MIAFQTAIRRILIPALIAATASAGLAQTSSPRPALPAALISRMEARAIIDGAIAFAEQNKMVMSVVVVDEAGQLLAGERMDGGVYRNLHFAEGKAFAAVTFGQTTEELGAVYKTRPDRYFGIMNMYPNKVYLVGGGEPLVLDGKVVGAVGVAGLPEGVDEKAGRAGIAAWMTYRAAMKK